jgi:hypothetical protein
LGHGWQRSWPETKNLSIMEKLIKSISEKGYVVSFSASKDDSTMTISISPKATGMGVSTTIASKANYHDALKAMEFKLFQ